MASDLLLENFVMILENICSEENPPPHPPTPLVINDQSLIRALCDGLSPSTLNSCSHRVQITIIG